MQRMEADVFRPRRNCKAGILTARDETIQALEQGSAGVEQGERTGTIGLNGAGYSTTDKVLSRRSDAG